MSIFLAKLSTFCHFVHTHFTRKVFSKEFSLDIRTSIQSHNLHKTVVAKVLSVY